ncbi:MAG: histidine kinase [Saprospiraceae bacterium]
MLNREKAKAVLGFDDMPYLLIGIPIIAFFFPILFFKENLNEGLLAYLPKFSISLLYTSGYWLSIRALFFQLRKRFTAYEETQRRVLYTVAGILVIFVIVNGIVGYIHVAVFEVPNPHGLSHFDYKLPSLIVIALVSSIYESIFLYNRWKGAIVETEKLKRENVQSQLEGLKSQVNPHFLFNSLNTLIYIIPEDPDKAVTFVRKLSKVYRYILEIRDKELIPVAEELSFLQSYIFLLKERFGDSFQIDLSVPPSFNDHKIVPLSLQILLENAIKHNIISKNKPLLVELFINDNGHLVIRNNLQKKLQEMPSTNVGLENIKSRYAFFSKERMLVEESAHHFMVSLPLIKAPLTTIVNH